MQAVRWSSSPSGKQPASAYDARRAVRPRASRSLALLVPRCRIAGPAGSEDGVLLLSKIMRGRHENFEPAVLSPPTLRNVLRGGAEEWAQPRSSTMVLLSHTAMALPAPPEPTSLSLTSNARQRVARRNIATRLSACSRVSRLPRSAWPSSPRLHSCVSANSMTEALTSLRSAAAASVLSPQAGKASMRR